MHAGSHYTVVVTNTAGSVTSNTATLTVTAAAVAPQITTQPTDQSVTVGGSATFTVAATGTSLNYQWRKDGTAISEATSATYTLSGAAEADAGDYTVVVSNTVGDVTSNAATLTVTAVVNATVSIDDASVAENGGNAEFTVSLTTAVTGDVVLDVIYEGSGDNPAELARDLGAGRPPTVTIEEGRTSATITVPVNNDALVEGDETFTVTVRERPADPLPDGVTIDGGTATGTIVDNETGQVTLGPAELTAAEDGEFTYTVSLNRAADEAVIVRWTAATGPGDTATVDDDLRETTGTVTFAARNNPAQTFTIRPVDDNDDEDNETFTVTLEVDGDNPLPTGVTIGADNSSTATIIDDDDTAELSIAAPATAEEGSPVAFTVNLSAAWSSPVTVRWTATAAGDGAATLSGPNSDLAAGEVLTGTVEFAANDTASKTVSLETADDDRVEGVETFTVTLSEDTIGGNPLPDGVSIPEATAAGTGTITDNDAAELSIRDASAAEGSAVAFEIDLSALSSLPVTVRWTATTAGGDGAATLEGAGSDLTEGHALTGTVVFDPDDTAAKTVNFVTADDDRVEGAETFTVTLSADTLNNIPLPAGVSISPTAGAGTGTITDNDEAAVIATVNIEDADPVAEGAGPARFTVTLSRAVGSDAVLDIAYTAGSAGLEDLGSSRPATVTIFEGETAAVIAVPIVADDIAEGEETFTVTLTGNTLPDGVTVADGVATGTIAADSEPSVLIEPRRIGAGTALRRHVNRFDSLTGAMVRNRLTGSGKHNLTLDVKAAGDRRDMAVGSRPFEHRWSVWIDGAYAGIGGDAPGYRADIYGGVDYLAPGNGWLIGALIGYEAADLEIGEAAYKSEYAHFGLYGGARLSEHLLFDGAATYGMAAPDIALGDVSASYDANRITARGALTGDFGFQYGSVRVEPQVGLLYSRETLGAFTDSAGGVAEREILQLGRFSAGPRLTWDFDGVRVESGARMQWDFLQLDDGTGGRISGAADIGVTLDLTPRVTLGVQGDVDGIGVSDEFGSLGGKVEIKARF